MISTGPQPIGAARPQQTMSPELLQWSLERAPDERNQRGIEEIQREFRLAPPAGSNDSSASD